MSNRCRNNNKKRVQSAGGCSSYLSVQQLPDQEQTFSLMTFNIFKNVCKNPSPGEYVSDSNVDIICLQEDANIYEILNYTKLFTFGQKNKNVACFYNTTTIGNNKIVFKKYVTTKSIGMGTGDRSSIIFKYNDIKIANLHLEGGHFVDVELKNNFDKILEYKLKLLKLVIAEEPDIICGDFNSVYNTDKTKLETVLQLQYDYFRKHRQYDSIDNIKKWNLDPYELLTKNGYKYAIPNNENTSMTNNRGKTIVDTFWFLDKKIQLTNTNIINIMKSYDNYNNTSCEYSDHNPVTTNVIYKKVSSELINIGGKGGSRHKKHLSARRNNMQTRTKQTHKSCKTHNTHNTQQRKKHNKQKSQK